MPRRLAQLTRRGMLVARVREGIPVAERTWDAIEKTASELGLTVAA